MDDPGSASLYEQLLAKFEATVQARPPRASAAVVPWRTDERGELEVYWVRRSPEMSFMGGWHAFPGGGLARADVSVAVAEGPAGASETSFSPPEPECDAGDVGRLGPDLIPGLVACAVRELFEETGVLLAAELAEAAVSARNVRRLAEARERLLAGDVDFAELIVAEGWTPTAAALSFAGRWLTPPLAPLRFDNRFFLLRWEAERSLQPTVCGAELVTGEWIAPARALDRWRRGEVLAAPPILHLLRVLAEEGPEAGLGRLRDPRDSCLGPLRRVEFREGVVLLPLLTPTLPPATHTNAFLLGREEAVLIDPASPFPAEIDRLRRALAAAREQGVRLTAIWLTHHHRDHVGAVEALRHELGVPVLAHPLSAEPLRRLGIALDGELHDGQRVVLAGDPPFPVRVCHTPGHTRGHLCFYDEDGGSLLAGDLASALSTIVIDPPEGDMDAYLASLERMIALAPTTLFPAHGPAVLAAVDHLAALRDHRLEREEQVLRAWRAGKHTATELVAEIYAEVPEPLHPVAARQVEAHLARLQKLGKI